MGRFDYQSLNMKDRTSYIMIISSLSYVPSWLRQTKKH